LPCALLLGGLLLALLRGGCVLLAALAARDGGTGRGAGARVATDDFTDNRSACGAPEARTGRRARCGGGRRGRGLRGWRIGRVVLGVVDGPYVACALVLLLLVRRLPFGGLDNLLREGGRGREEDRGCEQ